MPQHQVAQGDTLVTIAHQYGFADWAKIYQHPQNAELRKERPNPMVLEPGDKVFVPEKEIKVFERRTGTSHSFRIRKLRCQFSVVLKDECDKPYSGCKYELKAGDETFSGKVGGNGMVTHEVSPEAKEGELKLWPDPDNPDECITWQLDIGHLDPVDTIAGVQARLNNLGFKCGPVDGSMNEATKSAIRDFQARIGYDVPTGEMDDRTRQALLKAHNQS